MSSDDVQAAVPTSADEGSGNEPSGEANVPSILRGIALSSLLFPEDAAKLLLVGEADEKLVSTQRACVEQLCVIQESLREYQGNPFKQQDRSLGELHQGLQDITASLRAAKAEFTQTLANLNAQQTE